MKRDTSPKRRNHVDDGVPSTNQPCKTSLPQGHRSVPTTDRISPDLSSLIDIAHQIGIRKRGECRWFSKGICLLHRWSSRKDVPLAAGKPVRDTKPEPCWRVKPTIPFCGFCPQSWYLLELHADPSEEET